MDDFEILLSSPYTWKPSKTIQFWNTFHNHIKNVYENKAKTTNREITNFRRALDESARKRQAFRPANNWKDALGQYHYELVTKTENFVESWWPDSLVTLLRVIRNKHEHQEGLTLTEKNNLEWFCLIDEKLQFDENMFVTYWTSKLPHLMPFIWAGFSEFKGLFREFYPESLDMSRIYLKNGVTDFVKTLRHACLEQIDNGFLHSRYGVDSASGVVELRILTSDLLTRVLDGSPSLTMVVSSESLHLKWKGCEMMYKSEKGDNFAPDAVGTYIFSGGSDQVDGNLILRSFVEGNNDTKNVLVFTTEDAIQITANKFSSNAKFKTFCLNWRNLSESKQKSILIGNQFFIVLNLYELPFKNFMPEDEEIRLKLLQKLESKALNTLLRTNRLQIFMKHKIPKVNLVYKRRELYCRTKLNSIIFNESLEHDVFIVVHNSNETVPLPKSVKSMELKSDVFPDLKLDDPNYNVIQVYSCDEHVINELKPFGGWESKGIKRNINFLEYIGNDTFKWGFTHGNFSDVIWKFDKAARKVGTMSEDKFIDSLDSSKERIIFIADQPGMGKTQVLLNLAREMIKRTRDNDTRFVMYFSFNEYIKTLRKTLDSKSKSAGETEDPLCANDIIKSITSLVCSNKFEEALLGQILSSFSSTIKVDIMLDGLDELNNDLGVLAIKALKVIEKDFQSNFRVWVSMRDHLLEYIWREFKVLGYKLKPFSQVEQFQFLIEFWQRSFERHGRQNDWNSETVLCDLLKFSANCVQKLLSQLDANIAGAPLQCQMIAESYEGQVIQRDFELKSHADLMITDLYDKIMERKMHTYITEKKSLQNDDIITDIVKDNIYRYLVYLAIKLVLPEDVAARVKPFLLTASQGYGNEKLSKLVMEHGMVESIYPIRFIHRTFAEYLIADFTYRFLANFFDKHDDIDLLDENFKYFLWNGILATKYEHPKWKFEHATLFVFLDCLLCQVNQQAYKCEEDGPLIHRMAVFARMISDLAKYPSLEYFPYGRHFVASCYSYQKGCNCFYKARCSIIYFLALSRNHLTQIFIRALRVKLDPLIYYLIEAMGFDKDTWYALQEFDKPDKLGILHHLFVFDGLGTEEIIRSLRYWVMHFVQNEPTLLEQRNAYGQTPLLTLATNPAPFQWGEKATIEIMEVLVNHLSADVNAIDAKGNSALHIGQLTLTFREERHIKFESQVLQYLQDQKSYFKLVEFLLANGCKSENLNRFNKNGCTPFLAFLELHMKTYQYSLEMGWKRSSLLLRMLEDAVKVYKNLGTKFNARDVDGATTLYKVIQKGYPLAIVKKLIECGSKLSDKNLKGQYPIHLAVERGDIDLIELLLSEWPPGISVRDGEGKTILQYETTDILRKYIQSKVNAKT